jgi:hypothetical protein
MTTATDLTARPTNGRTWIQAAGSDAYGMSGVPCQEWDTPIPATYVGSIDGLHGREVDVRGVCMCPKHPGQERVVIEFTWLRRLATCVRPSSVGQA